MRTQRGFTLVEMIMVIVIAGIIAGMVAVFLKAPVEGYFDTVRRAELTEEADAALRFLARDLQAALPNSIQCASGPSSLQFLSIRSGGRYREYPTAAGTGNPLQFGSPIGSFDVIGNGATSTSLDARGNIAAGNVVVGNLDSGAGVCNAVALADNVSALAGAPGGTVGMASHTFPQACQLQSATAAEINDRDFGRFYVVDPAQVSYACAAGLTRNGATLAGHATTCDFRCEARNERVQTVSLRLRLADSSESIEMVRQVHVVNLP